MIHALSNFSDVHMKKKTFNFRNFRDNAEPKMKI